MDEFDLINQLIVPRAGTRNDVVLGIGDDGAIVRPPPGAELVVVADTLVRGVHFPLNMAAADIGYRAAAVNLSDIAAMGAEPRWATLALTLPTADRAWLGAFMQGLQEALAAAGVALIGGDTTAGPLTITVQIIGSVAPGAALTRHGAQPGDSVYVTGTLGDAAAGLRVMMAGGASDPWASFLEARFKRPRARLEAGRLACGIASSCIDISDGLLADLGHLAQRSGCGAVIEAARLPLSPALRATYPPGAAQLLAATGGDDCELCFAVSPSRIAEFERLLAPVCALQSIGVMERGTGVRLLDANGAPIEVPSAGYRHFSA